MKGKFGGSAGSWESEVQSVMTQREQDQNRASWPLHQVWCCGRCSLCEVIDWLPDYEYVEDETLPNPFLTPAFPEREDGEGAEPDEEPGRGAPISVPPKRTVKRNMLKLDAQKLISERGLPALDMFDKVKFKGKGHEGKDSKTLIRYTEQWAHRLFPKLQFEDFTDRVEYLGNKKEVQIRLKWIRLDLPILHEDFISNDERGK